MYRYHAINNFWPVKRAVSISPYKDTLSSESLTWSCQKYFEDIPFYNQIAFEIAIRRTLSLNNGFYLLTYDKNDVFCEYKDLMSIYVYSLHMFRDHIRIGNKKSAKRPPIGYTLYLRRVTAGTTSDSSLISLIVPSRDDSEFLDGRKSTHCTAKR